MTTRHGINWDKAQALFTSEREKFAAARPKSHALSQRASGPFASTEPRPYKRSSSRRTSMNPGTVSMWPSIMTSFGPSPITPTALPTSSTRAAKPAALLCATRKFTASAA